MAINIFLAILMSRVRSGKWFHDPKTRPETKYHATLALNDTILAYRRGNPSLILPIDVLLR
jgi:hypothetical protein